MDIAHFIGQRFGIAQKGGSVDVVGSEIERFQFHGQH
jgi:hypothetical protein